MDALDWQRLNGIWIPSSLLRRSRGHYNRCISTSLTNYHYNQFPALDTPMPKDKHDDLTHWGLVTHICVGNLTIIGSDNGLAPGRRQDITWTNVGILLIGPLGTNFSEMLIEIHTFSFKKIHLKMSSGQWRPFCLGLNVLSDVRPNMVQVPKCYFM